MSTYKVVTGPAQTEGGICCGANVTVGGEPFEKLINEHTKDGSRCVAVFNHTVSGKCCCIIPSNVEVSLLVFEKD
jgi:hypothetical protein